ncbi:MAG: ArnT family glycosyltransferase [Myxococcota bacterium]
MRPGQRDAYVAPFQRADAFCLSLIVAWGLALLLPGLDHPKVHDWDEAFHQAAARGTYERFPVPHLNLEQLYPVEPAHWWSSGVWLHKPPAPFWFGAAMMHLVGFTPLALRLGSLLGQLGAAAALFLMLRSVAGRAWATVASMGFLALPFGWVLTQGHLFGDVTDCTLVGWVTLAMALLLWSVERDSWRWAAAAGAATGVAYLCKNVLSLVPLGVAFTLVFLSWVRFCAGPRLRALVALGASFAAVVLPWELHAATSWPEAWRVSYGIVFRHVQGATAEVGPWTRPVDGVFNELARTELEPLPHVLGALALLYLVFRALHRREYVVVALALWLGATWGVHTFMEVKVPAQVWNSIPAVFAALALLANDLWRSAAMGGALTAGLFTGWATSAFPNLAQLRALVPAVLPQTRSLPGLAEGLVLATVAALGGFLLSRPKLLRTPLTVGLATVATLTLGWRLLVDSPRALHARAMQEETSSQVTYTRDLGLALGRELPKKSVLWVDVDHDASGQFTAETLMLYAGRMAYRRAPDLPAAQAKDLRSYLVSPAAELFEAVPGVPAHAWLRAYDLQRPAPPPPLPRGISPLQLSAHGVTVLGYASTEGDARYDRWVFYVHAEGVPPALRLTFHTAAGSTPVELQPEASLRNRDRLADAAWFLLPTLGPKREEVNALEISGKLVALGAP